MNKAILFMMVGLAASQVLLESERNLILYDGRMTTGSRSSPVPQLSCIGGPCHSVQIDFMQCENVGKSQGNVQWKCTAYPEMDKQYTLGSVNVGCEGYSHKGDPYVLEGSCGVEYTIKSNNNYKQSNGGYNNGGGYQQHGGGYQQHGGGHQQHSGQSHYNSYSSGQGYGTGAYDPPGSRSSSSFRWILFLGGCGFLAYMLFFRNRQNVGGRPTGGAPGQGGYGSGGGYGGGGGGYGGGGGGYGGGGGGGTRTSGYGGSYTQTQTPNQQQPPQQQAFGGWTNFLTGAGLGYLLGGWGGGNYANTNYGNHYNTGYGGGGFSGGYGGGGGGYSGGGGGSSGGGGGSHSSTAFGGTSSR